MGLGHRPWPVDGVVPEIIELRGELVASYALAGSVKAQAIAVIARIRSIRLADALCCLSHRSQCNGGGYAILW